MCFAFAKCEPQDGEALEAVRSVDLAKLDHSAMSIEAEAPGSELTSEDDEEDDGSGR